jgi:endo-1,4-beta-D-glucanase Y
MRYLKVLPLIIVSVSFIVGSLSCKKDEEPIIEEVIEDTLTQDTLPPVWVDTTTTPFYYKDPKHPFPNKGNYFSGAILPNVDEATRNEKVIQFYKAWKKRYLKSFNNDSVRGNDTLKYVHYTREDKIGNVISCSEGHGFGMVITALMAGVDSTAYDDFVKLFNWYKKFKTSPSGTLMAWRQNRLGKNCDGNTTATDGDMDMAYALLLAHHQWGSDGKINFLDEAKNDIEAIYLADISYKYKLIELGDWVRSGIHAKTTRFCDHMLDHMDVFAKATNDNKWTEIIDSAYSCINQAAHDSTGLLPDFAYFNDTTFVAHEPNYLEGPYDGYYYYNSCRAPWRIAMNYIVNGDDRANDVLNKLNNWIKTSTGGDGAKIRGGYKLDGTQLNSYSDMSFSAPFGVAAMIDSSHQQWLDEMWGTIVSRPIEREKYFGNSIKMICLITMSGNWWVPEY